MTHIRSNMTHLLWRLDRLGRSLPHLIETVRGLAESSTTCCVARSMTMARLSGSCSPRPATTWSSSTPARAGHPAGGEHLHHHRSTPGRRPPRPPLGGGPHQRRPARPGRAGLTWSPAASTTSPRTAGRSTRSAKVLCKRLAVPVTRPQRCVSLRKTSLCLSRGVGSGRCRRSSFLRWCRPSCG